MARSHARAVASVVLYAARAGAETVPPVAARLFEFDPGIEVRIPDLMRLRALLVQRFRDQPASASRMHAALDDVIAFVAARQVERLERTAMLDELTGVGNRRAMDRDVGAAIAHALRHDAPLAVAMIDLDGLKQVNDSEGHAAGDELIRTMARALTANARAGDLVFRIGGDEFLVLCRDSALADAERLLSRVRPQAPPFSAGVAAVPDDGADAATILRVADARLYAGRSDRVVVAPTATTTRGGRLFRGSPGLVLVPTAAVLAEGVRRQREIDIRGAGLATWTAIVTGGPLALTAGGWLRGLRLPSLSAVAGATLASLLVVLPLLQHEPPGPVAAPRVRPSTADGVVGRPSTTAVDAGRDTGGPRSPLARAGTTPTSVLEAVVVVSSTPVAAPPEPEPGPELEAADVTATVSPRRHGIGRGDPHAPDETGDPHAPGRRGDPHRVPPPRGHAAR